MSDEKTSLLENVISYGSNLETHSKNWVSFRPIPYDIYHLIIENNTPTQNQKEEYDYYLRIYDKHLEYLDYMFMTRNITKNFLFPRINGNSELVRIEHYRNNIAYYIQEDCVCDIRINIKFLNSKSVGLFIKTLLCCITRGDTEEDELDALISLKIIYFQNYKEGIKDELGPFLPETDSMINIIDDFITPKEYVDELYENVSINKRVTGLIDESKIYILSYSKHFYKNSRILLGLLMTGFFYYAEIQEDSYISFTRIGHSN